MKPDILKGIITKVQSFGYTVHGVTCDNHSENHSLAKKLGCTDDLPRFPNPDKEGEYIFFFFDPVHLIKLVRNHLIDQGTV